MFALLSRRSFWAAWIAVCCLPGSAITSAEFASKPRLMVLTDIGGDPDDQQSMVRLMTYANEFEVEGLIATASGFPRELKEHVTRPDLIREIVETYGKVHENLVQHAQGYPTVQYLLQRIKSGTLKRGLKAIGEGHDSEASKWIVATADRPDPRPLNITIWGGQTDLAQALWRVREDRGSGGLNRFISKIRVYDIGDQDGIADWILDEFPGLFYILGQAPKGRDKREAVYRGMYLGGDESLTSRAWMETHIRQNHGPLGALYPPKTWTAPNPHSAIKEGDTPSWFFFLPLGLNVADHPEWGGWGGRFLSEHGSIYRDAHDSIGDVTDARCCVWRWRSQFQADFEARLDWCVAARFDDANHNPVALINRVPGRDIVKIRVKCGRAVKLSAEGSTDPDGDEMELAWFVYPEAGSFRGTIALPDAHSMRIGFLAPQVNEPETIHVILQVKDHGIPPLYSLRRAVVTVEP